MRRSEIKKFRIQSIWNIQEIKLRWILGNHDFEASWDRVIVFVDVLIVLKTWTITINSFFREDWFEKFRDFQVLHDRWIDYSDFVECFVSRSCLFSLVLVRLVLIGGEIWMWLGSLNWRFSSSSWFSRRSDYLDGGAFFLVTILDRFAKKLKF
jgi:hypothetical protein